MIDADEAPPEWLKRGAHALMLRFAAGKSSALVVDIGASVLSVTPVHDGLMLKKGQFEHRSKEPFARLPNLTRSRA